MVVSKITLQTPKEGPVACSSQAGLGIPKESAQCSHHPHSSSLQQAGLAQGGHHPIPQGPEAEAARGSEAPPRAGARLWGQEGSRHLPFRGPLNMNTAPGLVRILEMRRGGGSEGARGTLLLPGQVGSAQSRQTREPGLTTDRAPKDGGTPCTEGVGVAREEDWPPALQGEYVGPRDSAPPQLPPCLLQIQVAGAG